MKGSIEEAKRMSVSMQELFKNLRSECKSFTDSQITMKGEIKMFESMLEEFRAAQQQELLAYGKQFDNRANDINAKVEEIQFSNT